MLPSNGPILQYKAIAYDTTDGLLYTRTIDNGSVFQYTFTDLNPVTTYKLSIIGINSYGEGFEEDILLQATTQAPIGMLPLITYVHVHVHVQYMYCVLYCFVHVHVFIVQL